MSAVPLKVRIRAAVAKDQPNVVRLVRSILAEEFPADQAAYPTPDLEDVAGVYAAPESVFLVAESPEGIVGTCGVKSEDEREAVLRRLFVDKRFRGQGIGWRLLKGAIRFCRDRGYGEVVIRTSTRMRRAIQLCRGQGFEEDGSWDLGGVTLIRFRKKLS